MIYKMIIDIYVRVNSYKKPLIKTLTLEASSEEALETAIKAVHTHSINSRNTQSLKEVEGIYNARHIMQHEIVSSVERALHETFSENDTRNGELLK